MPNENEQPDWLQMVRNSVTKELWQAIINAVATKAVEGDLKALDFFARCVLPKDIDAAAEGRVREIRFILGTPPEGQDETK